MHELTICQNIIKIIEENALKQNISNVKTIKLAIGVLSGIELDALTFSFPIAAKNSVANNAELDIEVIQGQAFCRSCSKAFNIEQYMQPCVFCGGFEYDIIQGKELKVVGILM